MNSKKISFSNKLENLEFVRNEVSSFLKNSCSGKILNRIVLSIDEAISNSIEHGFRENEISEIQIEMKLENHEAEFIIIDSGIEFDPTKKDKLDIDSHLEIGEDGGVGIHIFQKIMKVNYKRIQNQNYLTLKKNLGEEND